MKKITSAIVLILLATFSFASFNTVYAVGAGQEICQSAGPTFSGLCKIRFESNTGGIVGGIVSLLLIGAIIIALFFLVFAGVHWITSGGDKAKIESARSTLIAAVVGLVISLSAFMILNLVLNFVTGQGLSGLTIPRLID